MPTTLFVRAIKEIEDNGSLAIELAADYGYALHEVATQHWFVLRVANAILGVR